MKTAWAEVGHGAARISMNTEHSGAIVTIKGRGEDVRREYPEASNTPLSVQMKGPHQAKSLYQPKQPLLL